MIPLKPFLAAIVALTLVSFGIGVGVGARYAAEAVDACAQTAEEALRALDAADDLLDAWEGQRIAPAAPQITEEAEP